MAETPAGSILNAVLDLAFDQLRTDDVSRTN